jgi:hypothetical protein
MNYKSIAVLPHVKQLKHLQDLLKNKSTREELEEAGKYLTKEQVLLLLHSVFPKEPKEIWKISPLLVGLPHPLFRKILLDMKENELKTLKVESLCEPLQHHLSLLSHELNKEIEDCSPEYQKLSLLIRSLNLNTFRFKDFLLLREKIELLEKELNEIVFLSSKALALAWHAQRKEIVEKLTQIKEGSQRFIHKGIGAYLNPYNVPESLYALLENKLNTPFTHNPSQTSIKELDDKDSAFEALAKLNIWYLKDYFLLGLLPSVKSLSQLNKMITIEDFNKRREIRDQLYSEIKKQLSKIGLEKVKDFKHNCILTKESFTKFISEIKKLS